MVVASSHLVPVRSPLLAARLAQLTAKAEPTEGSPADSAPAPQPKLPGYCSFSSEGSSTISSDFSGMFVRGVGALNDVGGSRLKVVR